MRAPVTLDLHLANFTYPDTPPERLFERIVAIAQAAEESGWSSVSVMDHLIQIPPVGPPEREMLEGNTILAGIAARTSRVSVGLLVGGVTYRNPALLAKITTTLDIISGGRAVLGIGAAWFEAEHRAYGFRFPPLKERFEHLEDALQITRAMFTQERPSFEGTHHRIDSVLNNPRPLRGDIPIIVGGSGERKTLRLVARYADGCNVMGDVDHFRHLMSVLDRHCEDVGRDPREITRTRMATVFIGADDAEAERKLAAAKAAGVAEPVLARAITGGPERVAEQVRTLVEAGVEGLTVTMPDAHDLDAVRLAGETIGPLLGAPAPA
jgi:F420-dependent oxidoreductase-like protein